MLYLWGHMLGIHPAALENQVKLWMGRSSNHPLSTQQLAKLQFEDDVLNRRPWSEFPKGYYCYRSHIQSQ